MAMAQPGTKLGSPREYYAHLANHYDWFWESREGAAESQMRRLVPVLLRQKSHTVLDCACGTGLQTVALAHEGFDVTGSDLSDAMLEQAAEHCRAEGVDIPLVQADVRELARKFVRKFGSVICMGNVLPHLPDDDAVLTALKNIHTVLEPGGLFVFDQRYYDKMLEQRPRFIPHRVNAQENGGRLVTILYILNYLERKVRFDIVILVREPNGETHMDVETVDYNPVKLAPMRELLAKAGFAEIDVDLRGDRYWCTARRS